MPWKAIQTSRCTDLVTLWLSWHNETDEYPFFVRWPRNEYQATYSLRPKPLYLVLE